MATQTKQSAALTSPGYFVPFIIVTALFFIFGFITNLNMALVPHLRRIFELPYAWAMLAESAFFLAYFVFSSPTSKLIEMIGRRYQRDPVQRLRHREQNPGQINHRQIKQIDERGRGFSRCQGADEEAQGAER